MKAKVIALSLLFLTLGTIETQAQKAKKEKINTTQSKQEEKNKQLVKTAYQRIFGELDTTAVDEYMSKDFKQHNPTTPDGSEGVKTLLKMLVSQGVQKQAIMIKHIVAEGDIVILHSRYEMAGKEWRFIDIYRIENGKLVEHWDAYMPNEAKRGNNNSMF